MTKENKKPWLSALINFILPGIGYVYNGKRVGFGLGVFLVLFMDYFIVASYENVSLMGASFIISIFLGILFAYDGYQEAKEINKRK